MIEMTNFIPQANYVKRKHPQFKWELRGETQLVSELMTQKEADKHVGQIRKDEPKYSAGAYRVIKSLSTPDHYRILVRLSSLNTQEIIADFLNKVHKPADDIGWQALGHNGSLLGFTITYDPYNDNQNRDIAQLETNLKSFHSKDSMAMFAQKIADLLSKHLIKEYSKHGAGTIFHIKDENCLNALLTLSDDVYSHLGFALNALKNAVLEATIAVALQDKLRGINDISKHIAPHLSYRDCLTLTLVNKMSAKQAKAAKEAKEMELKTTSPFLGKLLT